MWLNQATTRLLYDICRFNHSNIGKAAEVIAYTYHYLNWFSKTSIIKWHEVSKNRIAVIAVVWLGSLALYAYNYDTGMAVLYFISVLHVMLEFPLDHRTFVGIGRELYAIAK